MSAWNDELKIKTQEAKLGLEQTGFSFGSFIRDFPRPKRLALYILLIALIPTVLLARYGGQALTESRLKADVITAHQAFVDASAPKVGSVHILNNGNGTFAAYATIENPNLELGASNIPYQFMFYNSKHVAVAGVSGGIYLLPNQKKYIVAPRVTSPESISSGEIMIQNFQWQKKLSLPEVSLKAADPILTNELNPLTLAAEGAVVNQSPYHLAAVRLIFLLYDKSGNIVAVSQRDEQDLTSFSRRAYKQLWPNISVGGISRAQVLVDTNVLDGNDVQLDQAGN